MLLIVGVCLLSLGLGGCAAVVGAINGDFSSFMGEPRLGPKKELEDKRSEIAQLQQNLSDKDEELNQKNGEISKLESDLQNLQKEFDALKSEQEASE